ncbi:Uncharacterised protein [Staphylococcus gallinarum]|uniref:Uncharacterized protein n=1 Tax=Staphylococcus gallinarum TaxID=1293 RepID=A0A380FJI3_STAGA|nr:Uncharacterised protein [Staphylococcus gallinarum]
MQHHIPLLHQQIDFQDFETLSQYDFSTHLNAQGLYTDDYNKYLLSEVFVFQIINFATVDFPDPL